MICILQGRLNWSVWKKTIILYIASLIGLTGEDGGAIRPHHVTPPSSLSDIILTALRSPDRSTENGTWVPDHINHAIAGNFFMLGAGKLLYGFLRILDAFRSVLSIATPTWSVSATSFESLKTARQDQMDFVTQEDILRLNIHCVPLNVSLQPCSVNDDYFVVDTPCGPSATPLNSSVSYRIV